MARISRSKVMDSGYINDFFLSNNITQGEKIPFFILWKGEDPLKIEFKLEGFKSFIEFYNVASKTHTKENTICATKFHINGYVGGLIETEVTEIPITEGTLNVKIIRGNGQVRTLNKKRKLYTTALKIVNNPESLNFTDIEKKICIHLRGKTTVFINIEELEGNQCNFIVPPPLCERIEHNLEFIQSELNQLKIKVPNLSPTIKIIEEFFNELSVKNISTEKIKVFSNSPFGNEPSFYSLIDMITSNLLYQQGISAQVLKSFSEYLNSYPTDKAFFSNPLMFVRTPRGTNLLAIKIVAKNLLCQECSSPIELKKPFFSEDDSYIDLRKLISFQREDYALSE